MLFDFGSGSSWSALNFQVQVSVLDPDSGDFSWYFSMIFLWLSSFFISPSGNISSSGPNPVSTNSHSTHEQLMSGPGPNVRDSPPQASHRQQQMGANKARRSLDTNFHNRQVRTHKSQISLTDKIW